MQSASEILEAAIRSWVEDPDSDVVYSEMVEGRWAVRMRQTVREATTVWWTTGERSISAEAYVVPAPLVDPEGAYRLCLIRNARTWRTHFALDRDGAIVLRGRIGVEEVTAERLDLILAEFYEMVELSFGLLVRMAVGPREKSG